MGARPARPRPQREVQAQGFVGQAAQVAPARQGTLRCGLCGEAMLPRSRAAKQWYVCRTRAETGGVDACAMPVLERANVDDVALAMFEARCLDVDQTRARFADRLVEQVAFTRAEADRAGREHLAAIADLAKVDEDYESGQLSAATYERQLAKHTERRDVAEAEATRLSTQADEVEASIANLDAESEVLRRLHDLREAIADRVRSKNGDVDALRAALAAVFAVTTVADHGDQGLSLAPVLRDELVPDDGSPFQLRPKRRVPLHLSTSAGNNAIATQVLDQIRTSSA